MGVDRGRRPGRRFVLSRLRKVNRLLDRLETAAGDGGGGPLRRPPVFIVGAPRSGSTLLYQMLVQAFDVGYLSNRHCRLWGAPSLVERLTHTTPPAVYESRFGRTTGPAAPSECEGFWYRFFERSPQYVPLEEADPDRLRRLRASVRRLGGAAGRPLIFKNLLNTLRLQPLGSALPEALFVWIRRDLVANAASLLESRRKVSGELGRWWSAEPPEIEQLRLLPPEEQVVEQVRRIEALVERDREALGAARFVELRYEEVCDDTGAALRDVARLAEQSGFALARRQEIPSKFERSGGRRIERELYERIADYARG